MKPAIIYMLEVLACSGVLLAAYAILLERRVKFRWCRLYLLLTPLAAALIPLLRIPVWPGRVITATPAVTAPALPDWMGEVLPDEGGGVAVTPESFFLGLYLLGTALIAGVMVWQVVRIRRLRRGAEISRTEGFTLVRTRQEIASFSFLRTIYIWDKTPAGELAAILAHESSHIAHRHSVERILMELMKALLWWNPFAWIAARRLTEAEEFEADNDVLNSGYDRADYMQTIFKQLFGYSPEIANGLRNSLTKKRFKMMTKQTKSRHGLLRLAGTLPAVIGLLCAFGFTSRAAVIVAPATAPATGTTEEPAGIRTAADAMQKQDKTCTATLSVVDKKDKHPIEGALVQAAGTPKGTVTGKDGRAVITVPEGSELKISYIGYEPRTIAVNDENPVVVSLIRNPKAGFTPTDDLPDAPQKQQQEQVTVSVATYKDKAPLAGALVKVSGSSKGAVTNSAGLAELRVPANSALEISYIGCKPHIAQVGDKERQMFMFDMQAETAGTPETPGTSESLATATAMDKPLYIVNGIETKEIGKLDPDRIESMSVLKDKAATALYGEKARNGVIVITLKGADMGPATSESNGKADDAEQTAANAIAIKNGKTEKEEAFLVTETMPLFPTDDPAVPYGDLGNFRAWVQKNVKYPAEAFEKGIGGRVVLSFVVEKDGSVSDIQKLQAPDASLWEEARRVIASSPKWKPGKQRGQIVRVKYTLPVDFRLTKASDTPAPESGK